MFSQNKLPVLIFFFGMTHFQCIFIKFFTKPKIDTSLKVFKLLEMLEDLDDTQNVTSNIEFAEGMLDQLD